MTLSKSGLADSLEAIFDDSQDGHPADESEAGQRWAKAYKGYAADAMAAPTAPLSAALSLAETTLAQALAAAFSAAKSAGAGGLATVAPLLDLAFVSFWLTPPMTFLTTPPGPVTGLVTLAPPGVLSSGFTSSLAPADDATAADQAQLIASALDTWTRTVMVLNTTASPPSTVTVPLT
jgi:hypothetical protein